MQHPALAHSGGQSFFFFFCDVSTFTFHVIHDLPSTSLVFTKWPTEVKNMPLNQVIGQLTKFTVWNFSSARIYSL